MNFSTEIGKLLMVFGSLMVLAGVLVLVLGKLPIHWRLPGDIVIQKPNFVLYFPLATCIVLSILLSLLFYFLRLFRR